MNKRVKILISIAIVVILVVVGIFIFLPSNDNIDVPKDTVEQNTDGTSQEEAINNSSEENLQEEKPDADFLLEQSEGEAKVTLPTFMYFISEDDKDFEKTNEVLEKLKKEYDGLVNFDIRNVTKEPENLENFPVEGNTPALIMLNYENDITNFLFKNGNYDDLKQAIITASR